MGERRYFWMKFQRDFFKSLRIKRLRRLAGGDTYTIIYLKLQLLSIINEGYLEYKGVFDSFAEELAEDIDEDIENIEVTMTYLLSCGLMEQTTENKVFLPYAAENIGSECGSAKRVRDHREKQKALQCNADVTNLLRTCNVEKEIDIEIDKDIEDNTPFAIAEKHDDVKDILNYLNEKAGTNYRATTDKTRKLIKARMKEGFTVDDFKTVIDKKVTDWKNDPQMNAYLRPETLFGNKFEGYLNQQVNISKPVQTQTNLNKPKQTRFNNMETSEISSMSEDELAALVAKMQGG